MERVAFLIEETNQRLSCLLNPESLAIRRSAGVRLRRSANGKLTGPGVRDDPLLFTGGGRTELEMELLFDVSLLDPNVQAVEDVRDLTGPFWSLTENTSRPEPYGQPPLVRFIWGKSWNIPGIVVAVSEHLEYFTSEGIPRRSWMRLRMVRVNEEVEEEPTPLSFEPIEPGTPLEPLPGETIEGPSEGALYEVVGGSDPVEGMRPDMIAYDIFNDPAAWRWILAYNGIIDPFDIDPGVILRIPPTP